MKYPSKSQIKLLKQYRIIILESADQAGKSTLGRYLHKKIKGSSYYHDPLDNKTGRINLFNYYKNIAEKSFDGPAIFDRSFYSGIVYDKVCEHKTHPTLQKRLEPYYENCCIIYCEPSKKNKIDRPEVYDMDEFGEELNFEFKKLWQKSNLPVYTWDYVTGTFDNFWRFEDFETYGK